MDCGSEDSRRFAASSARKAARASASRWRSRSVCGVEDVCALRFGPAGVYASAAFCAAMLSRERLARYNGNAMIHSRRLQQNQPKGPASRTPVVVVPLRMPSCLASRPTQILEPTTTSKRNIPKVSILRTFLFCVVVALFTVYFLVDGRSTARVFFRHTNEQPKQNEGGRARGGSGTDEAREGPLCSAGFYLQ